MEKRIYIVLVFVLIVPWLALSCTNNIKVADEVTDNSHTIDFIIQKSEKLVDQGLEAKDNTLILKAERVLLDAIESPPATQVDMLYTALGDFYMYDRYHEGDPEYVTRFDLAEKMFRKALEVNSKSGEAYAGLAVVYAEGDKKDYQRVIELLEKAKELDPKDPYIFRKLGYWHFRLGNYEKAKINLKLTIEAANNPDHEYEVREAKRLLGRIYTDEGKFDLAEIIIKDSIVGIDRYNEKYNLEDGCPYQALGRLYTKMGRGGQSVDLYVKTAGIAKNTDVHQYLAAVKLFEHGDTTSAQIYLDKAKAMGDKNAFKILQGFLHLSRSEFTEAEDAFQKAMKEAGESEEGLQGAKVGYGHLMLVKKKFKEATENFKATANWNWETVKNGTDSVWHDEIRFYYKMACLGMGWALANQNQHDPALPFFENILLIEPDDIYALLGKGNSLITLGKNDQAAKVFEKVLKLQPDNQYALAGIGAVGLNIGQTELAEESFKKALEIDDKYLCPYQGLGLLYLKQGRTETAKLNLEMAVEEDPDIGYKKFNALARIHIKEGDLKKAEELLKRSMKNFPEDTEAENILAELKKMKENRQ